MSRPAVPASLTFTPEVMQTMIKMCRLEKPRETCGFIVANKESPALGIRVHYMKNVAENPLRHYQMDDDAVVLAYGEFDDSGEEPIACFHSHPASEAVLSAPDLAAAADEALAYVVVSLAAPTAKVRAYRVQHFIGAHEATEIPISLRPGARLRIPEINGPWALAPGNYVRIGYQRTSQAALSVNVSKVLDCDDYQVRLDPDHKTAARSIPIARIQTIHVIRESPTGRIARDRLRAYAGQVRTALVGPGITEVPGLLADLSKAFPREIRITMEGI